MACTRKVPYWKIVERLEDCHSAQGVANSLGIAVGTVYGALRYYGISLKQIKECA